MRYTCLQCHQVSVGVDRCRACDRPGNIDLSGKTMAKDAQYGVQHEWVKADPWVKVGTTTIDGTLVDVANVLEVSSWPIDWARDAVAAVDLFMRAEAPWLVGGRRLVAKRSHVNEHAGTALIHCDIVRRQSEIEAERQTGAADGECRSCRKFDALSTAGTCASCCDRAENPCPECGPHGNRGEVLLASSWAKCTTCAGGKTGDLWGEVKAESFPGVKSYTLAIGDLVFEEVEVKRGFKVPTLLEMRGAALDGLRRHLESNVITYDDSSIVRASQVIEESLAAHRSWLSAPISVTITES